MRTTDNKQPDTVESAVLSHWCASVKLRHGPQMVANDLTAYPGDPDFEESDLALSTRFFWRTAMAARHGPEDEREDAYFEIYGLCDEWENPKLAYRARQTFAAAPMAVDVSMYL
ncbi:hypothetical protein E4L95_09165 [Paracoccus liaowanqingii]|uniref:Uncharacterized protein n=1 Tax=Paracoccus liaowanqingii TaxID=2560053 RepID=A0A4Z1C0F8_9RHOB|nr:hypothetical protein [Paracoccus liaowanqingii]TGN61771.1 hypothetical protein E4L95_09165 [Paracoccus liaowanqingii]